ILVQETVYDDFLKEFCNLASNIHLGDGTDPSTDMGPMIDENQRYIVERQVEEAVARGATVLLGGKRPKRTGYFYEPTVLIDLDAESDILREETFGPVAPIESFESFEDALELANESKYGLASIVCTQSASNAITAIEKLDSGMLKINGPRGKAPGATSEPFKLSGMGHGYGLEYME